MSTLAQDLRHGFRLLLKSPGFTLAAVLVLALGIGANTAIFSVVSAVLLKPLPYPESDRLVSVFHTPPQASFPGFRTFSVSPGNYFDWERQNSVFSAMTIVHFGSRNLTGVGEPEALSTGLVSRDFFTVLKDRPLLGRSFTPEEAGEGHQVAILTNETWKARFGGDPAIVGRDIQLDGESYRVIGVLRPGSSLVDGVQVWMPVRWTAQERAVRSMHDGFVVARLKPGVDMAKAQAEMDVISQRLEREFPEDDKGWGALVTPLREELVGEIRPVLLVLLGSVALVLLIGCANVANLVLARTLGRRKEIAVRTALGASRSRLVQQLVVETVVLSVTGGLLGLLFAKAGLLGIVAFLGDRLPRAAEVGMSGSVFLFALLVSMVAGVLAGIAPAWKATQADVATTLKQGLGRTDTDATGNRTRSVLIVSEVALSLVLLIGAGLLLRSLWLLQRVNPGFDPGGLLTLNLTLPKAKYPEPARQAQLFDQVLQKVRALPGVESAGAVDRLPLTGGGNWPIAIEGRPQLPVSQQPVVAANVASADYFKTMRIPVLKGRAIAESDRADAAGVAVISEAMARKYWPGEDPIGKRFSSSFYPDKAREVVGVVGDVKRRGLERLEAVPVMYFPYAQIPRPNMAIAVRARGDLAAAAVDAVHQIDPAQPVAQLRTMSALVADSLKQQRSTMLLLGGFACLAVVLATVGIYSVLSYLVKRRGREMAIRLALGARAGEIVRLVVAQGMRPVLLGIALGLAAALALGRVLSGLVYRISATDPPTFAAVAALLSAVALAACLFPAWQATRIGPIRALREE